MAYAEKLIDNEDMWIQLVNDRNDDAYIYQESSARAYASRIVRDYMPFMETFLSKMSMLIPADDSALVKIPKSFVDAAKRSGMYYDEFLKDVIQNYQFENEAELFRHWNQIKSEYSHKTTAITRIF